MSPLQFLKALVLVAILSYLAITDSEARNIEPQDIARRASDLQQDLDKVVLDTANSNIDQIDTDNDDEADEDDAIANIQSAATNSKYQSLPLSDLKTSASHHHHGHGVKGWLDMGAWTGKKGAFGWYDKHPVGGKKGK